MAYYATRPRELLDRLASEYERRRERDVTSRPMPIRATPPIDAVHEVLELDPECADCREFESAWSELTAPLGERYHHHDSGLGTVKGMWAVTRHLRPEVVVETGVARGLSTAAVLAAMRSNGMGHLFSIDLPEVKMVRDGESGVAVNAELRDRWTLLRGGSRRLLPKLLDRVAPVDVFLHDSLHTASNMTFEMEAAWLTLRSGGILFVDDADQNEAFLNFVVRHGGSHCFRERDNLPGAFGIVRKP